MLSGTEAVTASPNCRLGWRAIPCHALPRSHGRISLVGGTWRDGGLLARHPFKYCARAQRDPDPGESGNCGFWSF